MGNPSYLSNKIRKLAVRLENIRSQRCLLPTEVLAQLNEMYQDAKDRGIYEDMRKQGARFMDEPNG